MRTLQALKKSDLTLNDALIFARLAEGGSTTQTDVADATGLALSVVSQAVSKYVLSGHLREGPRDDRNARTFGLTAKGLKEVSGFLYPDLDADRDEFDLLLGLAGLPYDHDLAYRQLKEELSELAAAKDPADRLDALVDLIYFAMGAIKRLSKNKRAFSEAWKRVHAANMKKVRASKSNPGKRNDKNDAVKPEGWTAPDLSDLV